MHNGGYRNAGFWIALLIFSLWCIVTPCARAVPRSSFYPNSTDDISLGRNDDGASSEITIVFPFFGTTQTTAYVNNNGVISFGMNETRFNSEAFPINGTPIVSPYWGDVDTRGTGDVRYRVTNDSDLLKDARKDVLSVYPEFTLFNPTKLLIATWDAVGRFNRATDLINSFQCIMITDGTNSFVIFLYADDLIQWSRGNDTRVRQVDAQGGFNAGDGIRYLTINGSQTPAIVDIETTSNIGVAGKYLFRVDGATIITPPPEIVSSPMNQTIVAGTTLTVNCTATAASSTPTITWRVGDIVLTNGDRHSISGGEGTSTLVIANTVEADSGTYSCTATVGSETPVTESFDLTVISVRTRPENDSFVEIVERSRNGTEIFCQFSGLSLTTTANGTNGNIRWFLNEVQIDFEQDSQFFGVQFSVVNVTGDQVVSSNLTVSANLLDVPISILAGGIIMCLPPEEVEGTNIFGLFRTTVVPRIACMEGDVRLIELSENEGIVEVCKDGSYRPVCLDHWDHREASVVCRQRNMNEAGISTFAPEVITESRFSEFRTSVVGISCYGNESNLASCLLQGGEATCDTTRLAAVRCMDADGCEDGDIRTVSRNDRGEEGRVEVCFNGVWGAVYSVSAWNVNQVGVICREGGHEPAGAIALQPAPPVEGRPVPQVVWPVHIDCNGSDPEATLKDCQIELTKMDIPNPSQSFVAGFQCRIDFPRSNCTDGEVRISEQVVREDNNSGLVEVCQTESWHSLCSSFWNNRAAEVACRQLGFPSEGESFADLNGGSPAFPRTPPLPTFTLRGECSGDENQLQECEGVGGQAECPVPFASISCEDQPAVFLNSPRQSQLDIDSPVFAAEVGRIFELECTSNRNDIALSLERNGVTIVSGFRSVSLTREVTEFDEGDYSCIASTSRGLLSVRNFTISVSRTDGSSSSAFFRLSTPMIGNETEDEDLRALSALVLALISEEFEGAQEVKCSVVDRDNRRQEDVERRLDRVECVISNYPPVESTSMVAEIVVEALPVISPVFAFLIVSGNGFCDAETAILESGQVNWPETRAGSDPVIQTCPGNTNRTVTRECTINANWTEADYDTCRSFDNIQEQLLNITEENVIAMLDLLNSVVRGAPEGEQNAMNAVLIANVLNATAFLLRNRNLQLTVEEITDVVNSTAQILDSQLRWDPEVLREQGSEIVESFEDILVSLINAENFTALQITGEDIALLARRVLAETLNTTGLSFSSSLLNGSPTIGDTATDSVTVLAPDQIASIQLPPSLFAPPLLLPGPVSVAVTIYEEPTFFPLPLPEDNAAIVTMVGTPVVSLLLSRNGTQLEFRDLDPPLVLNLRIFAQNVTDVRCVFWDFQRDEWSPEGCETEASGNNSQVTCTCTHLTNFAALVDVCRRTEGCDTSSEAEFALGILSIVGVSLSLVGLVATVITMLIFKRLRKRDATKFHVQLCIAMLCMLLVFVTGVQRTSVFEVCVTVSLLIHYFTLVTVMWMGAEAVLMFQKLIIVFVRITTKYLVTVSLICWLAPLVPVIIPVAINPDYVIIEAEGSRPGLCFIGNTATFFAAFLAPILAIILFNFVVFFFVIAVLIRHTCRSDIGGVKKKDRKSTIRLMISIIGIMSIFGLTWVFGALTVDKASLAFQIIFVILNSLQGFIIFLFFCVFGREGRELWIETLCCGRYKSAFLHPSSATSTGNKGGKKIGNVLLSSNTDSSGPVVEKNITSETTGGSYVTNYVEFSQVEKQDLAEENGKAHVTTVIDSNSKPETTTLTFKGEENTVEEKHENGSTLQNGHFDKHSEDSDQSNGRSGGAGEDIASDGEGEEEEEGGTRSPTGLRARIKRYSTRKEGRHHVETYEVDFDEENTA